VKINLNNQIHSYFSAIVSDIDNGVSILVRDKLIGYVQHQFSRKCSGDRSHTFAVTCIVPSLVSLGSALAMFLFFPSTNTQQRKATKSHFLLLDSGRQQEGVAFWIEPSDLIG